MLDARHIIAAEGSKEQIKPLNNDFIAGKIEVFRGDYTGVDPFDENNTYDLNNGFTENERSSAPMFCYVLKDVITVLD